MQLTFQITAIALDGTEKSDVIEMPSGSKFKAVLREARSKGFKFGYGILSINGTVVPASKMTMTLDGKMTKNANIRFVAQAVDRTIIDLDTII